MNLNADRKWTTLLFNPFLFIAGLQALVLGLGAILLAGFLGSLSHAHFDGVLDTHYFVGPPPWVYLCEGIIDWLCLALVLLLVGKIFSKTRFRAIDILGTQALARWPTIFISLLFLPKAVQRFNRYVAEHADVLIKSGGKIEFNNADAFIFFAAILALIPLICWTVLLMYKSYSVSCNLKGAKAVWTFIGGLLVAEILSKIAVYGLFKLL